MGTKQEAVQTSIPEAAASEEVVVVGGVMGSQTPHVSSDIISSSLTD